MNNLEQEKDFKKIFSKRLHYYLIINGLTRNEFIDQINRLYVNANFKYQAVARWLNAEALPRMDKVEIMANFFNISKIDLLEDKNEFEEKEEEINKFKSLKDYRIEAGYTVQELADKMHVNKSTISRYENKDITTIPNNVLAEFAIIYKTTVPKLLNLRERSNYRYKEVEYDVSDHLQDVPIIENVKAGMLIDSGDPNFETFKVDISLIDRNKTNFVIKVDGESMEPLFLNSDYILCVEQPVPTCNGQICVVALGDSAPLIKRLYKYENKIVLKSENTYFDDIVVSGEQLEYFRMLGIPKHLIKRSY